ncbi:MAG: IclR family transcriptional regulator [Anaerolineaceae bacterium]
MSRPIKADNPNCSNYNIRVLERAVSILSLLADGKPRTPAAISEAINLNQSTTFRLLSTLTYHRYVNRDKRTNQYQLGLACLELAHAYYDNSDLRRVALPELEALRNETKETVHLAILDEMEIVYLDKLPGLHAIGLMSSRVGRRSPAFCTGVGKALLAYQPLEFIQAYYQEHGMQRYTTLTITNLSGLMEELAAIHASRLAFDRGEHEDEVRCVASPIFDITGQAIAALSISGPAARMDPVDENYILIELAQRSAQNISRLLGYKIPKNSCEENKDAKNHTSTNCLSRP